MRRAFGNGYRRFGVKNLSARSVKAVFVGGGDRDTRFAEKFVVPCKGKGLFSVVRQAAFVGESA